MSSYTLKYVMPFGFKIQGHTPSQEEYDQMMELLAIYAASLAPIQTPITTTPSTQAIASSSQEATGLEIVIASDKTPLDTSTPKIYRVTSLEAPIDLTSIKEPEPISMAPGYSEKTLEVVEELEPLNFETSTTAIQKVTRDLDQEFADESQDKGEETDEEEHILLRSMRRKEKRVAETPIVAPVQKRPRRAATKKTSAKKKLPPKIVNAKARPFIDHLVIDRGFLESHKLGEVLEILDA